MSLEQWKKLCEFYFTNFQFTLDLFIELRFVFFDLNLACNNFQKYLRNWQMVILILRRGRRLLQVIRVGKFFLHAMVVVYLRKELHLYSGTTTDFVLAENEKAKNGVSSRRVNVFLSTNKRSQTWYADGTPIKQIICIIHVVYLRIRIYGVEVFTIAIANRRLFT